MCEALLSRVWGQPGVSVPPPPFDPHSLTGRLPFCPQRCPGHRVVHPGPVCVLILLPRSSLIFQEPPKAEPYQRRVGVTWLQGRVKAEHLSQPGSCPELLPHLWPGLLPPSSPRAGPKPPLPLPVLRSARRADPLGSGGARWRCPSRQGSCFNINLLPGLSNSLQAGQQRGRVPRGEGAGQPRAWGQRDPWGLERLHLSGESSRRIQRSPPHGLRGEGRWRKTALAQPSPGEAGRAVPRPPATHTETRGRAHPARRFCSEAERSPGATPPAPGAGPGPAPPEGPTSAQGLQGSLPSFLLSPGPPPGRTACLPVTPPRPARRHSVAAHRLWLGTALAR